MYLKKLFPFFLLLCLSPFVAQATVPAEERDALMALYNDTNGAGWIDNSNWTTGDPCVNHWYGITCDLANITVTNIGLRWNNLSGSLPIQLGNFPNLATLDLYSNQLTSDIPIQLGNLSSLEYLLLGQNQLTGSIPKELGNLLNLESLRTDSNQLTDSIPKDLGKLHSLRRLDLRSNQFTGSIPVELGNLQQLQSLLFSNNHLTGSIPKELGSLTQLKNLELSQNQLTGEIPDELGSLSNLEDMSSYFEYNALYTANTALDAFLDSKQFGGDWSITQTVAPADVTLDSFTTNSASLQWDLIEYTNDDGSYRVYYSTNGASYVYDNDATANKSIDNYTFTGLSTTDHNYCFVVRTVTEPNSVNYFNRLESNDSNQVCIINGEIDADGDGLGDDTEDRDACYTTSLTLLAGEEYLGIGNTTLSSADSIITENTGTIKTLAPHQLILKAPEIQLMTGLTFSVESGSGFIISSQPDACP